MWHYNWLWNANIFLEGIGGGSSALIASFHVEWPSWQSHTWHGLAANVKQCTSWKGSSVHEECSFLILGSEHRKVGGSWTFTEWICGNLTTLTLRTPRPNWKKCVTSGKVEALIQNNLKIGRIVNGNDVSIPNEISCTELVPVSSSDVGRTFFQYNVLFTSGGQLSN